MSKLLQSVEQDIHWRVLANDKENAMASYNCSHGGFPCDNCLGCIPG